MILYYVRHGDPIYDPDSLTPLGIRQAEAVGRRLALQHIDKIYSSPSTRARQTAQPLCELTHKQPVILDWCDEALAAKDFMYTYENYTHWIFCHPHYRELLGIPEITALGHEWYTHELFKDTNAERGIKRIRQEAYSFLAELGFEYDGKLNCYHVTKHTYDRIALFAHQGFGLVFLSVILGMPFPLFSTRFDISHSTMSVIEFPDDMELCVPKALQLSNDSHLYAEKLPTRYNNEIFI